MKILLIYYFIINVFLYIAMGIDKLKAKYHKWRIKEATLLLMSLIGGGLGGFFGMLTFHHKNRKWYLKVVFIFSIIIHLTFLIYLKTQGAY